MRLTVPAKYQAPEIVVKFGSELYIVTGVRINHNQRYGPGASL